MRRTINGLVNPNAFLRCQFPRKVLEGCHTIWLLSSLAIIKMSVWVDLWSSELNINFPHWTSVCRGWSENRQFGLCRRWWCTNPSLRQNTKQHTWWIFFNLYVKSKAAVYWIVVIQFKNLLFWLQGGHQMCLAYTCSTPHPKPTAAASSGCPHGPSIEMSSSLLHWTTAARRNEPYSVDVEGDITGYNSPTPTRTVTGRLMSVCEVCWLHAWPSKAWTSGQEMTSRDTETRCLLGLQKPLLS